MPPELEGMRSFAEPALPGAEALSEAEGGIERAQDDGREYLPRENDLARELATIFRSQSSHGCGISRRRTDLAAVRISRAHQGAFDERAIFRS